MSKRRRISPLRLLVVAGVSAGIGVGGTVWALQTVEQTFAERAAVWYAPYVDVTLTPATHFEDPLENPSDDVVLSFVVADREAACQPSWGTYYDLDAAERALDLDRRIARLRERGGDAMISFGGAVNDELARTCDDVDALRDAYQSVIERYDATRLDFDIEGEALGDVAANDRRARALAELQRSRPELEIWLTVPVATDGMTAETVALLETTLAAGVELRGVNVMTMNYGGSRTGHSMAEANELALNATYQQVAGVLARAGRLASSAEVWAMIGATPMIGQNDVASDVFTMGDADALIDFARQREMGRLSLWSVNRDHRCGVQIDASQVSDVCSGVEQEDAAFGLRFNDAARHDGEAPTTTVRRQEESRDDPAASPYPIWRSSKIYVEGDKVVWHRNVYQAKWWSQGNLPDAPIEHLWDTPWRYLGPVLPTDAAALAGEASATVTTSDAVRWTADRVFVAGDEVAADGEIFRARWWTQGVQPQADPDSPFDHPWEYVGPAPEELQGPALSA